MNTEQKLYPIERVLNDADHLADSAEQLLLALNKLYGAEAKAEAAETATNVAAVDQCQSEVADFFTGVRLATHEYRKRARRYRESVAAIAAAEQAQQAEPVNQQQAGVYHKFNVSRTDGRDQLGGDRYGAEYFVLDVTHDKFAKPALAAYAAACRNDYPALADDMVRRYRINQLPAEPVATDPAVAAIQFALEPDSDGLLFLRLWNEGEFDLLRENWPEAPEAIYMGADPLLEVSAQRPAVASDEIAHEMEANAWRAALRGLCTGRELMTPNECAEHVRHRIESAKNAAQQPAVADRDAIRRVFMAHGFTIKEGQADLKPYVYEAAEALLRELSPAVAVPDGYALVPIEPTPEMLDAADNALMAPLSGMERGRGPWRVYRAMLAAAPQAAVPACQTCNGHGMIGGLLPNGGGYDGEPCPDCAAPLATAEESSAVRSAAAVPDDHVLLPKEPSKATLRKLGMLQTEYLDDNCRRYTNAIGVETAEVLYRGLVDVLVAKQEGGAA